MKEQKQLEVILSVFKGEKRSCKVGVARGQWPVISVSLSLKCCPHICGRQGISRQRSVRDRYLKTKYRGRKSLLKKRKIRTIRAQADICAQNSREVSRSSTISCASTSGSGRLSDSSRLSYLSQKMSQRARNKVETSKSDSIVPLCQKIAIKHQGCSFLSQ